MGCPLRRSSCCRGESHDIKLNRGILCGVSPPRYCCLPIPNERAIGKNRMPAVPSSRLRSREARDSDAEMLAGFLGSGLGYSREYFLEVLKRLTEHPIPAGFPKYGYVLEKDERIVGAILLIFSTVWSDDAPGVRCHVTSWYVESEFRPYATLFFSKALRHSDVTYINVSARPDSLPIIK